MTVLLDPRNLKALEIAAGAGRWVRVVGHAFAIPSQSGPRQVYVTSADTCQCPDSERHPEQRCKHSTAVALVLALIETQPAPVVSGGADGVDTWAEEACERRGIPIEVIRPRWTRPDGSYNKAAGFERNEEIVKSADQVLVIWNGKSHGSRNDIDLALRYHKQLQVDFPEP